MIRLISFLMLVAAVMLASRTASAHAVLLGSTPVDGAVLAHAPTEVVLSFDEPVRPIKVELLDASGRVMTSSQSLIARDTDLHLALPRGLGDGTYLVSYRVTSLDSHPVGGSLVFSIGKPSPGGIGSLQAEANNTSRFWSLVAAVNRLMFFIGLIGAGGGLLFHWLVARDLAHLDRQSRRGLIASATLGILASLIGIGVEGASLTGAAGLGIFNLGLWRIGESTSLGVSLTVATIALILVVTAVNGRSGRLVSLGPPAAVVALGSLALTGHALTAGPVWLTAPVLASHVLVAAFWLGSLWPLWQAAGRLAPAIALRLLRRFSAIALPAVALLIAAGIVLAVLQLGRIGAFLDTAYGIRLLAKLAFVSILVLIAALNRLWLTPALAAGRPYATHRLRASIGLEMGLGLAILAATSSLGEVPPPRALLAQSAAQAPTAKAGFSVVTFAGGRGALIEVTPAARGPNTISIHLFGADGEPFSSRAVTVEIARPEAGVEPIDHPAETIALGSYRWEGAEMPLAGAWSLKLQVLISDFEEIRFETSIAIH
jgi:copper transport protein